MRYLTKNRALLSAAALLAGVSLASAQGQQKEAPGAGGSSPGMSSGSGGASAPSAAPSGGGGEKMDRGAQRPSMPERTTGQGANQGASESKSASEPKADPKAGKAAQDKASQPNRTTGQGSTQPADTKSKASGKSDPAQRQSQSPSNTKASDTKASDTKASDTKAPDSKASDTKSGTTGASQQNQPSGSAATQGSTSLDAQKQSSIQQSVLSARNAPRVTNVNFSVTVGTAVPRHVRYVSLSTYPILIETFPQYRGHSFFIVEEEIVIIEPRTRKIVHVVPVGSGRASRGGSTTVTSTEVLQLSEPEIREVQLVLVQRGLLQRTYVTGVLDQRTRTALITFQRREGLSASGSIDTRTVSSLGLSGKISSQSQGSGASGASSTSSQPSGSSSSTSSQSGSQPSASQPSSAQPSTSGSQPQGQSSAQQPQGTTGQSPATTSSQPSAAPSGSSSNQGTGQGSAQPAQSPQKKDPAQNNTGSQAPAR
jgi:hypothetical protein